MAHAVQVTIHYQTYLERPPRADLHPKKVNNLGPIAPRQRQIRNPRMSRAVPSGRREGMFPDRYSQIFGLGERLGCILNLSHSFDAIEAYL